MNDALAAQSTAAAPAAAAGANAVAAKIPLRVRVSWGLGSLGTISYLNAVTSLVLVYMTTVLKIEPALAGSMVGAARLIDAFSDPFMGSITDRTRTRWGRRRPWMLVGAFVCGLGLPLVFAQHLYTGGPGIAGVAFAALVVYSLGFTVFNVPYLTMPVEMTTDRLQRLDLMSYRSVFMMLGSVAGSSGAPLLVEKFGRGPEAYAMLGLIGGGCVFVLMLTAVIGTHGAHAPADDPRGGSRASFAARLRAVLDNRPFMMMVGIKLLQFVALSAEGMTRAFFVVMVLKRDFTLLAELAMATIFATVLSIPLFRWLGRHITKRTGLAIGIVGEVIAILLWLLATPEDSDAFFIFRGILAGIFGSAILLFSQAMWLDTIDYDRERSGERREGLFTSLYVFIERFGYSVGPIALGWLLQVMAFDTRKPLEQQPASAETAVILSLVALPAAAYSLGLLFLWFYRLPERIDGAVRV